MTALPPHQALIFDLDGTLLDTEPLYGQSVARVLAPHGKSHSREVQRRTMGRDAHDSARINIAAYGLPHTPEQFLAERETHLVKLFPDAAEIPGAGAFLQQQAAKGVPLALATSSHAHLTELKLQKRPWKDGFAVVVCGDDPALQQGKPAPDIYLLCAQRLDIEPAACLAFEDSRNGLAAAKAAGMQLAALRSPYTEEADLAAADLVINNYQDLLP